MLLIDGAHEGSGWWKDFVHEDENGFLWCKLDTFPDHIDELPHGKILHDVRISASSTRI